jgi:hypothetical protein
MNRYEFRWIEWNLDKVARHGVSSEEAEDVVRHAQRPYPILVGNEKRLIWGSTSVGRALQVIYLVDVDDCIFVIHARPLSINEKRKLRRRRR